MPDSPPDRRTIRLRHGSAAVPFGRRAGEGRAQMRSCEHRGGAVAGESRAALPAHARRERQPARLRHAMGEQAPSPSRLHCILRTRTSKDRALNAQTHRHLLDPRYRRRPDRHRRGYVEVSGSWTAPVILSLVLLGCSDRIVTESWDDEQKPWYVGQPVSRGTYHLVPGADRALIFRMGDGVQGFPGKISGLGTFRRDIVDVIKSCSREDMHVEPYDHGVSVVVRSSDRDRETVECVRRFATRRFSAGYGRADIATLDDTTPFQDFENEAN